MPTWKQRKLIEGTELRRSKGEKIQVELRRSKGEKIQEGKGRVLKYQRCERGVKEV